jgi:Uma2 family endonuclease
MAETELHVQAIILLFEALLDTLPMTAYVAADMFWYWEEGHPESRVAPDVMVIPGVGRAVRRSFFTWREGGAIPSVVFEMVSEGTYRDNLGRKRDLYARLGVREYVLFDAAAEHLRPPLMAFRLVSGRYQSIDWDADDRLWSEELGVWMKAEGAMLRLFDGTTSAPVLTRQERAEEERLRAEEARLRAEEAQLRAEEAQLRAEEARLRAEQERLRADQERAHVEQERQRADALAAEVKRLAALLEQAGRGANGGQPK